MNVVIIENSSSDIVKSFFLLDHTIIVENYRMKNVLKKQDAIQ
jgi:hypothetical protein